MRHRGGGDDGTSSRHPNVPSLSTLLISDPPLIIIEDDDPEVANKAYHHSKSSPLLSPVDSHYASSISSSSCCSSPHLLSVSQSLPPLQGDDPPKRLKRHPSISSISSITSSCSSSSITKPTLWHVTSPPIAPIPSPSAMPFPFPPPSSSFSPVTQPSAALASPSSPSAPCTLTRQPCRSASSAAATTTAATTPEREPRPPLPPSTQIIVNQDGETILKRRRGRLPSLREPLEEGGWTFLTPTVWDVKNQQPTTPDGATAHVDSNQPPPQPHTLAASITNGGIAVFSSSNGEQEKDHNSTLLQMPRKKRGRKPKTQMAGNSCFVWKDISATRRSTKAMKLAQQQQKEREHLADQDGSTSSTTTTTTPRLRRIEQAPPAPASANIH